jgi:hypothetical protein
MEDRRTRNPGVRSLLAGLCLLTLSAGLQVVQIETSRAQDSADVKPVATADAAPQKRMYYVDFRARTAASYGHAFVWYGRTDQRKVEVAGLHPASDSVIPYIVGHVIPVPSETGASYGDLDEQYLLASYRVYMDEAQARRVFAYIKRLQATSPLWNAALYNCVAFIQDIARYMGLNVPHNHVLYPETWVNQLRALNGGGKTGRMPVQAAQGFDAWTVSAPPPTQTRTRAVAAPPRTPSATARPRTPSDAAAAPPAQRVNARTAGARPRERDRLTDGGL